MKRLFLSLFILLNTIFLIPLHATTSLSEIKTFKYTFSQSEPFKVAFADYPKGEEKLYELAFTPHTLLPKEINTKQRGLKISGKNHSDDLFMYAYKKITGLKPNTSYHMNFSIEFASNAREGSIGTGGSPGDSVYVKIGAVAEEPKRVVDDSNYYRIALDKGNQMLDGNDMILVGTIGVDTEDSLYRLKTLPYQPTEEMQEKLKNYRMTSNSKGEAWVVFGTDSGFEYTTTIFYTSLYVTCKEII